MGRRNLNSVKDLDRAWNARRWDDYAELIDDSAVLFIGPHRRPHGKSELVRRSRELCRAFPDAHLHIDPYVDLFMSHDGNKTCSIARLTATRPHGSNPAGDIDLTVAAVSRWEAGKLVEVRNFLIGHPMLYRSPLAACLSMVSAMNGPRLL
ncbi:nuclear transport factor 2 family protein [Rhizobium jaguaris]|uniref:nuclear transport factor 2 family protein n=1 Tax=Rhizobium jaguaris TaxID=1312183 RepID=UPI0013C532D2|nr:nuclear transport factor 2 family protein [Rhizobium jaguaris]